MEICSTIFCIFASLYLSLRVFKAIFSERSEKETEENNDKIV